MTEYRKIDLHIAIRDYGSITVDVVPQDNEHNWRTETFTDYDTALNEILFLENENDVYF